MFYKKQKLGGKWYPRSFTVNTVDTKEVARRLSLMSTVTVGDTYAVLLGLTSSGVSTPAPLALPTR